MTSIGFEIPEDITAIRNAIEALSGLIEDEDPDVREQAVWALGMLVPKHEE